MTYHESFIPDGCHAEDTHHVYDTTLTIGTGVGSDGAQFNAARWILYHRFSIWGLDVWCRTQRFIACLRFRY